MKYFLFYNYKFYLNNLLSLLFLFLLSQLIKYILILIDFKNTKQTNFQNMLKIKISYFTKIFIFLINLKIMVYM